MTRDGASSLLEGDRVSDKAEGEEFRKGKRNSEGMRKIKPWEQNKGLQWKGGVWIEESLKEKGSVRDQRQHSKGIELITAGRGARKMSTASSNTSTGHIEGVRERE